MDFEKLAAINLRHGSGGGDPRKGLCIMEMVSWFDGADTVTDRPSCACPVLTVYAIRVNDRAPDQDERNTLKPLLPLLSGSRDPAGEQVRAEYIVRETAHRIVAPLFDERWPEHAKAIRAAKTMAEIRGACRKAQAVANAAATAANVAANAAANAAAYANAANANAAYAANAANVAAAAANVAYAAAAANVAAAAKLNIWRIQRDILFEATRLGKHGGLDLEAPTTEARADQLLERVEVAA